MRGRAVLVLLPAAISVAVSTVATRRGPGLTPDSAYYIAGARSLANGAGVLTMTGAPLTHYPPAYSAVLALPALGGVDVVQGSRWVDAALFAALVGLVAAATWRVSGSLPAGVVAGLLVATARGVEGLGAMVLSGPLAILLALSALFTVRHWPVRSALFMSAALLTRYAMGAFWLTGVIVLGRRRARRDAVRWTVIAWLPVAAWLLRNELVGHSATQRVLAWHPPSLRDVRMGLATFASWPMLGPWTYALSVPVAVAVLVVLAVVAYRERESTRGTLAVAVLAYMGCLGLARSVADAMIPFDTRLLAPVAVCLAIIAASLLAEYARRWRWLWLVAAVVVVVQAKATVAWTQTAARTGLGYSRTRWQDSPILARLPANGPLYTNWIAAPYLLRGRVAREIPRRYNSWSGIPTPHYRDSLATLTRTGGSVVYFDIDPTPPFFPSANAVGAVVPLRRIDSSADGRIYRILSPTP